MPKIAVSYRRADSDAITGRIFDRLSQHYGRESVFRDIDNIPPGIDFRDYINQALHETAILLAIVGPKWLGVKGGQSRIMDEADPVRIEVETAMQCGIPVIPVLIGNTKMPGAAQLPDSLKDFAFRNALRVDPGQDFDHHSGRLIRAMDQILAGGNESRSPQPAMPLTPPSNVPLTALEARGESEALAAPAQSEPAPSVGGDARKPLCLVLMPFGLKRDNGGRLINFDAVYSQVIAPAIHSAEMEPFLASDQKVWGAIHKSMLQRVFHSSYALADLTASNPDIYYELGIRHTVRANGTLVVYAESTALPFDVAQSRGVSYRIDGAGNPVDANWHVPIIAGRLRQMRHNRETDSPIHQLIDNMPSFEVEHIKTDVFRLAVEYSREFQERLEHARRGGADAVRAIAAGPALANLHEAEIGIVLELFLALRDTHAYQDMIGLYGRMPRSLQRTRIVQEQLGFALHRMGMSQKAEEMIRDAIKSFGPESETVTMLARIYKDRWNAARQSGNAPEAQAALALAIDTYLGAFERDLRDAYSGLNALTLMEFRDEPDPRQPQLLPVVRYSAAQRVRAFDDYWDYASLLELAVLGRDCEQANNAMADTLPRARALWELQSTARNIGLIAEARAARNEDVAWISELQRRLENTEAAGAART
jgi:tetratricopeptide (TPR) repeat protein